MCIRDRVWGETFRAVQRWRWQFLVLVDHWSRKATGTRTRPADLTPFLTDGLKRHLRAASMAARSRSRLRLDFSTETLVTLPLASTCLLYTSDAADERSS